MAYSDPADQAASAKAWRTAHPDRMRAATQRWRQSNPELARQQATASVRKIRQRHQLFVDAFKAAPCVDCGGQFPPECMDYDHVRGTKIAQISKMMSFSPQSLVAEMAKCDLVCANCHRIRTRQRRKAP